MKHWEHHDDDGYSDPPFWQFVALIALQIVGLGWWIATLVGAV